MKLVLLSYKETSKGARMVADALGVEFLLRNSRFKSPAATICLNWGRGDYPDWSKEVTRWINRPEAVMRGIDKNTAFVHMQRGGVPVVPFTTNRAEAERWLRDGEIVVCRRETAGFNGSGIIIVRPNGRDRIVDAPLYTKYIKKDAEYRIHVMNGTAFYSNIKRKNSAEKIPQGADPLIRSGSHGWYFEHMDALPSRAVCEAAAAAVESLGLDFGGVDIIEERETGRPFVLEVNSAPELGRNTLRAYKTQFQQHYGQHNNNANVPIRNL